MDDNVESGDQVFIIDVDGELLGLGRAMMPATAIRAARMGPVVQVLKKTSKR